MLVRIVVGLLASSGLMSCSRLETPAAAVHGPGEQYALSSLDEVCDGAVSARDVLSRLGPEYRATLRYNDRPGTTALRIGIVYEGGEMTCMTHRDGIGMGPSRGAGVAVEMRTVFVTDDGAFDESFIAVASLFDGANSVSWESPDFHPGDLHGTWDPNLPGYANVRFALDGNSAEAEAQGALTKGGQEPGHVPVGGVAASWRP